MIKWIIQKTLAGEKTKNDLITSIEKSGALYELVEIPPFSTHLNYTNIDANIPIVFGSTTFILLALENSYLKKGVFFDNVKFSMSEYINHWGFNVLNFDAQIIQAGDIENLNLEDDAEVFVRPNEDTKSIAGTIMNVKELKSRISLIVDDNPYITRNSKLIVSSIKEIEYEWRNFIINKKVISSCRYRHYGNLIIDKNHVPKDMIEFCEKLCESFTPHDVFVMDIGLYDGEYKVIECNCFNGSGVYDNDLDKIVSEVNNYQSSIVK